MNRLSSLFAVLGAGTIAAILCVSACNDESPGSGGTRCGAATCAIGQACCLDCDGTGQCLVPGGACPGTACLAGGGAGGTAGATGGGGAGTGGAGGVGGTGNVMCGGTSCAARQICCIDCDGRGTCGPPGSACTGAACVQPRDGSADTGAGSPCKAMVVKEIRPGQCDGQNRYYWDGMTCATFDACGCEGADCARLFNSVATCMAEYASCAGSGQSRCGFGMCNANQVCCGGGNGCSCQPQGVPCAAPLPTCQRANCPEGTCVTNTLDVCEKPAGSLGNGCGSCGADGYCSSYVLCASPDTLIATPQGYRAIADLGVGDLVYSVEHDQTVVVPIVRTGRQVVQGHHAMRVTLATGAVLLMSAGHPTADGRLFADLDARGRLDGVAIVDAVMVAYPHATTHDILPATETGSYYAEGVLVGSTLR